MARIIVCGGSVIGLVTAAMLAEDDHEVTIVEADPSPIPENPATAWDDWDRRGVAQFRQAHNLLSRMRHVLDAELPGVVKELLDAGCVWVDPLAAVPPSITDWAPRPDDERFHQITGRRPVVEAVLAQVANRHPGVTMRRGERVQGLLGKRNAVPHVEGVVLHSGEELRADLVVDATGRLTKLPSWLEDLGGQPPYVESEDSGFVYYSRFFTGPTLPRTIGPAFAHHGTFSALTVPGDNNTWSVTLMIGAKDVALRGLRDVETFDRLVRACPWQAQWLTGEAISDVLVTGGILDRSRRFVVDGQPVASGVVAVGDARACTNPSAAMGLSTGFIHAQLLRHTVREGLDDIVTRFDTATEREAAPFFHSQIAADRTRLAQMDALREGVEPPKSEPMARAFGKAMTRDGEVFRAALEMGMSLATPKEVFAREGFVQRVMAHADATPAAMPTLSRTELLKLVVSD